MPSLAFDFRNRPVLSIRNRRYVVLTDLQPALGLQLLPVGDVTTLLAMDSAREDPDSVPVWYDGSGVCYVRGPVGPPVRLPVTDLPLWVGVDARGGLSQLLQPD